jgi:hypothetical protein
MPSPKPLVVFTRIHGVLLEAVHGQLALPPVRTDTLEVPEEAGTHSSLDASENLHPD